MGVGEECMHVRMCMTLRAYNVMPHLDHKLHSGVSPESLQAALRAPYDN